MIEEEYDQKMVDPEEWEIDKEEEDDHRLITWYDFYIRFVNR